MDQRARLYQTMRLRIWAPSCTVARMYWHLRRNHHHYKLRKAQAEVHQRTVHNRHLARLSASTRSSGARLPSAEDSATKRVKACSHASERMNNMQTCFRIFFATKSRATCGVRLLDRRSHGRSTRANTQLSCLATAISHAFCTSTEDSPCIFLVHF